VKIEFSAQAFELRKETHEEVFHTGTCSPFSFVRII
jgi:hypothetical protein